MKFIKNIKDMMRRPNRKYYVQVRLFEKSSQKYIGQTTVTTTAKSRAAAQDNVRDHLELHIGKAWIVKEHLNGKKR